MVDGNAESATGLEEAWALKLISQKEEGEEYEYASYKHGYDGKEEAHAEPALLVQPLGEEASANGGEETTLGHRIFVGAAGHGNRPSGHGRHESRNEGGLNCPNRSGCKKGPQEGIPKVIAKCVAGAGGYGFVGYFIDAAKLTPAGALASCVIGEIVP